MRTRFARALARWIALSAALLSCQAAFGQRPVVVASKTFAESHLLAEIIAQTLEGAGFEVERRPGLGGTLICFQALLSGEVDLYAEYTGTLHQTGLKLPPEASAQRIAAKLQALQLQTSASLGFNNTYAIVMNPRLAAQRGIATISDLRGHQDLTFGFTHEFRERPDGWPGLSQAYRLTAASLGLEHALAYQAIDDGKIDVTDAYATDGDLARYGLRVLEDDAGFFPQYLAVVLARNDVPAGVMEALAPLASSISDDRMRALNAQAVIAQESFSDIAAAFLTELGIAQTSAASSGARQDDMLPRLQRNIVRHLQLTFAALSLACLVGIGLGIAVHQRERLARLTIYAAGLLQTVPSIALFALMIPLFGIGWLPATIALFLYALLPILRNTITALRGIDPTLRKVAAGMGLTRTEQLRYVLMPLALPSVLAGLRTAAVICVGTATLAAFIGGGGLGEPIFTGLTLNNTSLILQGAIPAALLALLTELAFELLEIKLIPKHLRSADTQR